MTRVKLVVVTDLNIDDEEIISLTDPLASFVLELSVAHPSFAITNWYFEREEIDQ